MYIRYSITTLRPQLHLLDPLPVSKHDTRLLWRLWSPVTLTFDLSSENWHSTYSCPGKCLDQFSFFYFFCFPVMRLYRQTDRWMGKTRNAAIGWPHNTRKPSCRWQTRATLVKSLHGLRKSSGVVSCIARLPIDSLLMVSYYVLYSNYL